MRPVRVSVSGAAGKTAPVILDHYRDPFNVGVNVALSGSSSPTCTYTVEYTYDDVFANTYNPDAASAQWITVTAFSPSKSASADGTITSPVMAVRLNASALSATGTLTMTVIQAGMPGL
jgi:hypothetical protein